MKTRGDLVFLLWLCFALPRLGAAANNGCQGGDDGRYAVSYSTSWKSGIDQRIERQASRTDALRVVHVPEFQGSALRGSMRIDDDFTGVANGVPRVELAFVRLTRFAVSGDYEIRWSTMTPPDYEFDRKQPEIITQIHQSFGFGSPPFSLMLAGDHYQVDVRGRPAVKNITFGDTKKDRGRVVCWMLRYRPDDTGAFAVTDLYKDGALVVRGGTSANAYPNDRDAYLKVGIYKWDWKVRPSDVSERTMYYGDVEVRTRVESEKQVNK
ncbi:heparin lyase I family protein [Caballeronia pedi]|nr:heparin lyase I family protein [Caballeronia pedi]